LLWTDDGTFRGGRGQIASGSSGAAAHFDRDCKPLESEHKYTHHGYGLTMLGYLLKPFGRRKPELNGPAIPGSPIAAVHKV
jgi:hypothetical protein